MPDLSGWPILDVAVGLAFMFFLLSIVASSVYELIAAWMALRARNLADAIESLLGTKLAHDVYANWRIQALFKDPGKGRGPSYIPPPAFAHALLEALASKGAGAGTPVEQAKAGIEHFTGKDSRIAKQLEAILETGDQELRSSLKAAEQLFDDRMERASGWYKRRAQYVMWVIAAFVAFALNVNTFHVGSELWKNDSLRAAVATQAQATLDKPVSSDDRSGCAAGQVPDTATATDGDCKPDPQALATVAKSVDDVQQLDIPVGWSDAARPSWASDLTVGSLLGWLFGCLITAAAVSLGGPFWFAALQKLASLRAAGKRPAGGEDAPRGDAQLLVASQDDGAPAPSGEPDGVPGEGDAA